MLFLWDANKSAANLKKHKISFELARTVFDDPLHLSVIDKKIAHEERWVTIGKSLEESILVVVHLYFDDSQGAEMIRIISARKATRKEKKQYENGI